MQIERRWRSRSVDKTVETGTVFLLNLWKCRWKGNIVHKINVSDGEETARIQIHLLKEICGQTGLQVFCESKEYQQNSMCNVETSAEYTILSTLRRSLSKINWIKKSLRNEYENSKWSTTRHEWFTTKKCVPQNTKIQHYSSEAGGFLFSWKTISERQQWTPGRTGEERKQVHYGNFRT